MDPDRPDPSTSPTAAALPDTTPATAAAAARRLAGPAGDLAARFMFDPATYADAAAKGYPGISFYFAGRGGVLGDVPAAEAVRAFTFFPAETVNEAWAAATAIEPVSVAAVAFAAAAAQWGRDHLDSSLDLARLGDLAAAVVDAAEPTDAPLFSGWRALDVPVDAPGRMLHMVNALRELRFARHVVELRAAGADPLVAFMIRSPHMADIFGWPEPRPAPTEEQRALAEQIEEATDARVAHDLSVLPDDDLTELVDGVAELAASAS